MRSRLLLLVSVVVIAGAVWYASGQERQSITTGDAHTQTASDLLTGMLNQESGLRGYLLTGRAGFLAPYTAGRQQVERALIGVSATRPAVPTSARNQRTTRHPPTPTTLQSHRFWLLSRIRGSFSCVADPERRTVAACR
jgi:CHASE3 domain